MISGEWIGGGGVGEQGSFHYSHGTSSTIGLRLLEADELVCYSVMDANRRRIYTKKVERGRHRCHQNLDESTPRHSFGEGGAWHIPSRGTAIYISTKLESNKVMPINQSEVDNREYLTEECANKLVTFKEAF